MLAIVCPGQGAQSRGFLSPWLENAENRALLEKFSDTVRLDLAEYGTNSDEDTIKDTAISQPLIVSAGLIAANALAQGNHEPTTKLRPRLFSGHSVGEITASALSQALDVHDALKFVTLRAKGMAAASAKAPTGMAAVLGGNHDEVIAAIEKAGAVAANINGVRQIVASGSMDALKRLAEKPPEKARIVPLKVSGAFHTSYMASAQGTLKEFAATLTSRDPIAPLVSNNGGILLENGTDILNSLVSQVTQPVQWQACMERMLAMGVTGVLELTPAGTLTGLAKRSMPGVATFALKNPEQLAEARAFIQEHSCNS